MEKGNVIFKKCDDLHNDVASLYEAWVDDEVSQAIDTLSVLKIKLEAIEVELKSKI